jgi:hypothetical protein
MSRTKPETVVRDTAPFSIEPSLLAWVNEGCRPAGRFGFPGHAFELGLDKLLQRHDAVEAACRRQRRTFKPALFWALHEEFVRQSAPGKRGVRAASEPAPIVRQRIHATMSVELLERAEKLVGQEGGPSTMSQLVEVGLLLLRQSEDVRLRSETDRRDAEFEDLVRRYEAL